MRAVDIVDAESSEPAPALRDEIIQSAFQRGLLLLGCGEHAVRFCPPLCITAKQIEIALELFEQALADSVRHRVKSVPIKLGGRVAVETP
jgi:4-aminobutyrate aminotransferase